MKVGVMGAGSWGTTIANLLCHNGHQVRIWALEPEVVASINADHENRLFLAGVALDPSLRAVPSLAEAVRDADILVQAAPSHAVRVVTTEVMQALGLSRPIVVSLSKGLEPTTHERVSQILGETMPGCPVVILSGPSFATEVAEQHPTAVVAASTDATAARAVQGAFSNAYFRVYSATDVLGVELGGALKNVIAIAAGIADGLGLGHNPRAALITRGLAEMARLGQALGADPMTFAGLTGIGDLVLTCTGHLSRNRSLGVALGQGRSLDDILGERRTVAEGVKTAKTALELADELGVEMPITREVERILFEGKSPRQAIRDLMERELKAEQWR